MSFIKKVGNIEEYKLESNGLRILLYPRDGLVDVSTFNVIYLVGSRNECPGSTGFTHAVEHVSEL